MAPARFLLICWLATLFPLMAPEQVRGAMYFWDDGVHTSYSAATLCGLSESNSVSWLVSPRMESTWLQS